MLNSNLNLNENIFKEEELEKKALRDAYGEALVEIAEKNLDIVVLTADLMESTRTEEFYKKFPERFIECGIAEQNMVTIASGLALTGKIPFVNSYAVFSPGRNWEQIRTTICYSNLNVKIIGHHTGLLTGPDGATHQALEDIALMRVLPNMKVIVPCDFFEAKKAAFQISQMKGPVYLRLIREKTPIITSDLTEFKIGKAEVFWLSKKPQVLIIACGYLVYEALKAAYELEKEEKIETIVLNNHTIKPLDENTILNYARKIGAVVTVEEHQIFGGLGGAVSELLALKKPLPIEMVAVEDRFGESGNPFELIKKYKLDKENIKLAVKKVLKRKNK